MADGLRSQLFVRHADGPTLFMLRAIPLGGFALTDALRWRSLLKGIAIVLTTDESTLTRLVKMAMTSLALPVEMGVLQSLGSA